MWMDARYYTYEYCTYLHHVALAAAPTFPSHDTVLYTVGYVVVNRRTNFTCAPLSFLSVSIKLKNRKRVR